MHARTSISSRMHPPATPPPHSAGSTLFVPPAPTAALRFHLLDADSPIGVRCSGENFI